MQVLEEQRLTILGVRVPECCRMLGDRKAGGMIHGPRGCFISEVSLYIACCSSVPSEAATVLSDRFITGLHNRDDS